MLHLDYDQETEKAVFIYQDELMLVIDDIKFDSAQEINTAINKMLEMAK